MNGSACARTAREQHQDERGERDDVNRDSCERDEQSDDEEVERRRDGGDESEGVSTDARIARFQTTYRTFAI